MKGAWAKKGDVVAYGQMPELLRVLRRHNEPILGVVYDLQPLSCSGRVGVLRSIQAWRCSRIPRTPEPKPPRFSSIEELAAKHASQNGQSNGKPESDGSPTK